MKLYHVVAVVGPKPTDIEVIYDSKPKGEAKAILRDLKPLTPAPLKLVPA